MHCDKSMMDKTVNTLSFSSFNMTGAGSNPLHSLNDVLGHYDIVFLQETWLHDGNTAHISDAFPLFSVSHKAGFDPSIPLIGRPYGGIATCVKGFQHEIVDIESRRVLPVLLKYGTTDLLLVNAYFPYDKRDASSFAEFVDLLNSISALLTRFDGTPVLLAGDVNCDVSGESRRASAFREFCSRHCLAIVPVAPGSELNVSYMKTVLGTTHSSLIDWFAVSDDFGLQFSGVEISRAPSLVSDHCPVSLTISFPDAVPTHGDDSSREDFSEGVSQPHAGDIFAIRKMTAEDWCRYQFVCDQALSIVVPPHDAIRCDGSCTAENKIRHQQSLDDNHEALIATLAWAFRESNPSACRKSRRPGSSRPGSRPAAPTPIPGWTEHVLPHQRRMFALLREWKASATDSHSVQYQAYAQARREYHAAVRAVRKDAKTMRSEAIARSLASSGSSKEFWKRLKRAFPAKSRPPGQIGGIPVTSQEQLTAQWAASFGADFNAYKPDEDRERLVTLLTAGPESKKSECWSQDNVERAMRQLSLEKAAGPDNIPPEFFSYAPISLAAHVSLLFRACEAHGYAPRRLAEGSVHPVPKPGKNPANLDSYRPISFSCALSKVFESCVLIQYSANLRSSSAQFGFKSGSSTALCSMVVRSIAKHFANRNSRVFAAFLDAKKAFDHANFYRIMSLLLLRGIPKTVVSLITSWYEATSMRVSWRGHLSSNAFGISHGVKQGGLLSPALFSILVDTLLDKLALAGVGCKIGARYVGAFAYADDIVLLSPSVSGLRAMLDICSQWGRENSLSFNPTKSQVMCFADRRNAWPNGAPIPVYLNGQPLPTCTEVVHLGHVLACDMTESLEAERIGKAFNRQFYAFYYRFSDVKNADLMTRLYSSFCSSFYGLESLGMGCFSVASHRFLRKSVNLALMRLLSLPRESVSPFAIAYGLDNADSAWHFRSLLSWREIMCSTHPLAPIVLGSNWDALLGICRLLKILPCALPALSRGSLHDAVVRRWIELKNLL